MPKSGQNGFKLDFNSVVAACFPGQANWDHPLKTLACLGGEGVKNLPNLPTDSNKKLPTVGG